MADQAHDWTDEQIEALERKFNSTYSQAEREMRAKLDEYLKDFDEKNKVWQAEVRAGRATHEQYQGWLKSQSLRREYLSDMCDTLARDATRTNQLATDMINDELPRVYAENANYAAYGIESRLRVNTHAFDLVDQSTVRRLMGMSDEEQVIKEVTLDEDEVSPPLVTMRKLNIDEAKDVRWNRQKFNAALTQSILQGESIPNTAKRMAGVLNMGRNMAVRAARTAMTSAENAGRVDSYQRAKRLGIELEQEWLATLDERTRYTHRELDGQHVPVGEKFKVPSSGNELEFPGDPTAHPSEVWNCRCTLVAWFPEDAEESLEGRFSSLPKGMTYEQWKGMKEDEQKRGVINDGNPEKLAGVKRGRPMTFDEANELRGNPNYNMASSQYDELLKARKRYNEAIDRYGFSSQEFLDANKALDNAQRSYREAQREQNGYRINCQTCVVANEARRRGYDVEAMPNTNARGSVNRRLARNTSLAWIDPKTGKHPRYIRYDGDGKADSLGNPIPTHARFMKWLNSDGTVEEGARYTIEFWWKGRNSGGHIVCLERTEHGLRMYDPQGGDMYTGDEISKYLANVKYKTTSLGSTYADAPMLLKVSDYDFDTDICEQVLREARHDS